MRSNSRRLPLSFPPKARFGPFPILLLLSACAALRALPQAPPPLALIEASRSLPNDAERRFAARASDRLATWFGEAGLSVRRLSEEAAARDGIPSRIAVLPYNPSLSPALRKQLEFFFQKGGRLIVFYSSDSALAERAGLRLGPYLKAETPGQWSAIRFTRDAPSLVPPRLVQSSGNIRPAYPLEGKGRVIAWWEDAEGRLRPEPAWVLTDRAAWMSHLLLDGDSISRCRLLMALAVHFDPLLLPLAGQRARDRAGGITPYANGTQLLNAIRRRAQFHPLLRKEIETVEREMSRLHALAETGDWSALVLQEFRLQEKLAKLYGASLPSAQGEFRAVWNHSGLGVSGGTNSWERTAALLADHGFTAVFPHVAWAGLALYPSRLLPQSDAGRAVGDPLMQCLAASARHNLAVHAWVSCWNLEGAPPSLLERFKSQNRLQQDATGQTLPWLCPSHPDNIEHQLAILAEIAKQYPVAGVHLDYIRFPGSHACFCPTCRRAFESSTKQRIRHWLTDVQPGGPLAPSFSEWRAEQISRFVRLARDRLHAVRPSATLSAAVYGYYPGCIQSMGQDWAAWLRNGWVSFVCPMNYEQDLDRFKRYLQTQLPLAPHPGRIIPGIGVTASTSRLNPIQTLDQIEAVRAAGAPGFILFDLNPTLETELFPILRAFR